MRALFVLSSAAFLTVLLAGCSEGSDGNAEEAGKGWRAANTALAGGTAEFQSTVEQGVDGDLEAACPQGGSVHLTGSFEDDDRYDLTVGFDHCTSEGVTIDGEMSMTAIIEVTGSSSEVRFDYVGMLDFSGEVELRCGIDVEGRVAASSDGNMATAEAEFSGTVCGVSADAAIRASAG
jgi:hypothetical protein